MKHRYRALFQHEIQFAANVYIEFYRFIFYTDKRYEQKEDFSSNKTKS